MKRTVFAVLALLFISTVLSAGACAETPKPKTKGIPSSEREGYIEEYNGYSSMVHRVDNGGMSIYGRIFRPEGFNEDKKYPVLIMSHGYNATGADHTNFLVKNCVMNGILCYTFDFCGGSVLSKSDGIFEDMTVLTEVSDLTAVISDIKSLKYVEKDKIALFGSSYGGMVTSITAGRCADSVAAVILQAPAFSPVVNVGDTEILVFEEFSAFERKFIMLWGTEDSESIYDNCVLCKEYFGEEKCVLHVVQDAPHSFQPRDYEKCIGDINAYLAEMGIISIR